MADINSPSPSSGNFLSSFFSLIHELLVACYSLLVKDEECFFLSGSACSSLRMERDVYLPGGTEKTLTNGSTRINNFLAFSRAIWFVMRRLFDETSGVIFFFDIFVLFENDDALSRELFHVLYRELSF